MNSEDATLVQQDLSRKISVFREHPDPIKRKEFIRNHLFDLCLDRDLDLDETLEELNTALKFDNQEILEKDYVIPQSRDEKSSTLDYLLFEKIQRLRYSGEKDKIDILLSKYCKLTEIDMEEAKTILEELTQKFQINLIETDLYNVIYKHYLSKNIKPTKDDLLELINDFSSAIDATPEFTLGVLKNKMKQDKKKNSNDSPQSDTVLEQDF